MVRDVENVLASQTEESSNKQGLRVVLLGMGAINSCVARLFRERQSRVSIVGVITRRRESLTLDSLNGGSFISNEADLLTAAPDIIIEAASQEAVREWGEAALRVAGRFVVSSTGAFVDDQLLDRLRKTAKRCGSQLVLSSGALAGVEALSAASRLGLSELRHRILKPPQSWGSLPHRNDLPLETLKPVVLFRGSAREAAVRYPLNANVTIVSALASVGLDRTAVELVSDPSVAGNRHEIHARGDFGSLDLVLENRPIESNPKSSVLAALALIRYAENQVSEFVI